MNHIVRFMEAVRVVGLAIPPSEIYGMVGELKDLRERKGRLFILGVGGSAANASHAVNDFRKLCNIEAYAPTDNVAELSARTNDDGWEKVFSDWLKTSRLNSSDAILVLSVGGGDIAKNVSPNLVSAIAYAKHQIGCRVLGIVGRDDGYTAHSGDCVIIVPKFSNELVTPLSESFQSVLLHCVVSHPELSVQRAKWESL